MISALTIDRSLQYSRSKTPARIGWHGEESFYFAAPHVVRMRHVAIAAVPTDKKRTQYR